MTTYEEALALARKAIAKAAQIVVIANLFGAFVAVIIKLGGGMHQSWLVIPLSFFGALAITLAPLGLVLLILALEDTEDLE